ncbi:MAG: arsenate reductase ArsC [Azospirillaceae bacterium]
MANLPTSVLFVCTHNAIRSPMAEAIMKHAHGHRIFVDSAGVREGELDPFAVSVMAELDLDIARHRPKTLADLEDDSFDLVITLSPEAHHKALEMTRTSAFEVEYWPVMDPTFVEGNRETRLAAFREAREEIRRRIEERFPSQQPAAV